MWPMSTTNIDHFRLRKHMKQNARFKETVLACLSGPDRGKRFTVSDQQVVVGRPVEAGVLSDDPDVAGPHAAFWLSGERVQFQCIDGAAVYVDGHAIQSGAL